MIVKKIIIIFLLFFVLSSNFVFNVQSDSNSVPGWKPDWKFKQEIILPFSENNIDLIGQPIDVSIKFSNKCWAEDEYKNSIRICMWDTNQWAELESQVYDLEHTNDETISSCRIVFIIPNDFKNDNRFFIFYDDQPKKTADYQDHVDIEDKYFYYEPISGISAEGDYYEVTQDGYIVYGVGQKGQVIQRKLSQLVIKAKPKTKEFNVLTADVFASFAFSYHNGPSEEDEIASDQKLVSKKILINGNLMVKFALISESNDGNLKTTAFYRYYYCPNGEKRIDVNVKHEVLNECTISGVKDVDGRFGAIVSLKSRSERIQRMRFGDILPYCHVYGEDNIVKEYRMDQNPENKDREWLISYKDDCDVGDKPWISYDEGKTGKSHGLIFNSNKDIVKKGIDERDGIQLKIAEKEYIDIIGAEVDYAAINFGRNSFEKNSNHDLVIPKGYVVRFNCEFFTSNDEGYYAVKKEADIYPKLSDLRFKEEDSTFKGSEKIHTLTVIPRFTGRFFTSYVFSNLTGLYITTVWGELYKDDELVQKKYAFRPLFGEAKIKFDKIEAGNYVVKIYRKILNFEKRIIGIEPVKIEEDCRIPVYCTWQKNVEVSVLDQFSKGIENVDFYIYENNMIVERATTDNTGNLNFKLPFDLFDRFTIEGFYKGFNVFSGSISIYKNKFKFYLDVFPLKVKVVDKLGFAPGVDVRPVLIRNDIQNSSFIYPEKLDDGIYYFDKLPESGYDFVISYGSFTDKFFVEIPVEDNEIDVVFSAMYDLSVDLLDSHGGPLLNSDNKINVFRNGLKIYEMVDSDEKLSLPPGFYKIEVFSDDELVASKNLELTSSKDLKIITEVDSIVPLLVTFLVLIFICQIIVLVLFKRISVNSFLKLLAMSLILISLVQPWWFLNATNEDMIASKDTNTYIIPPTTVEKLEYNGYTSYDLATIPEIFIDFLTILLIIILSGLVLMSISFIPNILYKKRYSKVLITASILFLILVSLAFLIGMSKICEIGLGSLYGEGILEVSVNYNTSILMDANWGLGIGFYLCIGGALIAVFAGIIDSLKKENWPRVLSNKILRFR